MILLYFNDHANWQMQYLPGLLAASLWSEVMVWLQVHQLEGELEVKICHSTEPTDVSDASKS